jgi:hypothetical protein
VAWPKKESQGVAPDTTENFDADGIPTPTKQPKKVTPTAKAKRRHFALAMKAAHKQWNDMNGPEENPHNSQKV